MQIAPREQYEWKLRTRSLELGRRTLVMGILNVTPDSFSDGGAFRSVSTALAHAIDMLDRGADIVDIGGESTRPGAGAGTSEAISAEEEQARILPVIAALRQARPDVVMSVDTYRASTARAAIAAGAEIVNDVSGMQWDSEMAKTCAELRCGVVAMHTRGLPTEWKQQAALSADAVMPMVMAGLRASAAELLLSGCDRRSIVLDPGVGFGKRGDENWVVLRELSRLQELGFPLLVGLSRKGFLQTVLQEAAGDESLTMLWRDSASAVANTVAALAGAHIVRVHDVSRSRLGAGIADAIRDAG